MKRFKKIRLAAINAGTSLKAAAVTVALSAPLAFADGGVDFATAATDMKTQALAALAAIGVALLAVVAAVAAFRIGKGLIKG